MTESPVPAENVLARFLRALGDAGAQPQSLDEYVERFRTLTANRRMLFVLDDAASGGADPIAAARLGHVRRSW